MRRSKKRNTDYVKRKIKKKKRRGRGNMRLDYEKCKYIRLRMRKKIGTSKILWSLRVN